MTGASRFDAARSRAHRAKRALALASAGAFAVVLVLARVSHPGHAASSRTAGSATARSTTRGTDEFDFGSASVAPSNGAAPQVQTSVS